MEENNVFQRDVVYKLSGLTFMWDKAKSEFNEKKHKISFKEAATVFLDSDTEYIPDTEHSIDEDRTIAVGYSENLNLLIVCHCLREEETIIRIFSARKATRKEYKRFEEGD